MSPEEPNLTALAPPPGSISDPETWIHPAPSAKHAPPSVALCQVYDVPATVGRSGR